MSLAEARKEAKKRLSDDTPRSARLSFGEAYEEYKGVIESLKPRTQRDYKRMLGKHLALLHRKQLPETNYEDVTAITDKLSESERNHCLAVARTFLKWCVRPPRRYIPHSPLEGVEVTQGKKRKRTLARDEVMPVWHAAERQDYPHGAIVRLLLLTGQRRGEIANLRRPWINESERIITLPEWVTKNGKEHTFPYGDMTAAILESVPRRNSTDLLFPSWVSDDRPISGWSYFKKQLGDGVAGWTLHDLRRTFRTIHAEIGTPAHIGERLINHASAVQTDVEAIYDRYKYLPEMRAAMTAYQAHLRILLAC
jgi:integrase